MLIAPQHSDHKTTKKELRSSRFTVTNINPEFNDKNSKPQEKQLIESLYRIFVKYEKVQK